MFGKNNFGQLGLGEKKKGQNQNSPVLLLEDTEIKLIALSWAQSFILKKNGELFAFGYNGHGILGFSHILDVVTPTLLLKGKI